MKQLTHVVHSILRKESKVKYIANSRMTPIQPLIKHAPTDIQTPKEAQDA